MGPTTPTTGAAPDTDTTPTTGAAPDTGAPDRLRARLPEIERTRDAWEARARLDAPRPHTGRYAVHAGTWVLHWRAIPGGAEYRFCPADPDQGAGHREAAGEVWTGPLHEARALIARFGTGETAPEHRLARTMARQYDRMLDSMREAIARTAG